LVLAHHAAKGGYSLDFLPHRLDGFSQAGTRTLCA
jgi:hypothetical protein